MFIPVEPYAARVPPPNFRYSNCTPRFCYFHLHHQFLFLSKAENVVTVWTKQFQMCWLSVDQTAYDNYLHPVISSLAMVIASEASIPTGLSHPKLLSCTHFYEHSL